MIENSIGARYFLGPPEFEDVPSQKVLEYLKEHNVTLRFRYPDPEKVDQVEVHLFDCLKSCFVFSHGPFSANERLDFVYETRGGPRIWRFRGVGSLNFIDDIREIVEDGRRQEPDDYFWKPQRRFCWVVTPAKQPQQAAIPLLKLFNSPECNHDFGEGHPDFVIQIRRAA